MAVSPTLQIELDARRGASSFGYLREIASAATTLRNAGTRFGKPVGALSPDFALATPVGAIARLSALARRGPVVLSFFRGEWCPFCRAELEALQRAQPAMATLGATLVLVSPDRPSGMLAAAMDALGDRAYALQDPSLGVALQYGLVYRVPECLRIFYRQRNPQLASELEASSWLQPIPADFVVANNRRIALSFADLDFTQRLEPLLILETLEKMTDRRAS